MASSTLAAPFETGIGITLIPRHGPCPVELPLRDTRQECRRAALLGLGVIHSTLTKSRALRAAHICSATTATPRGVCTTSNQPLMDLALDPSK